MEAKDFNFSMGHLGIWENTEEESKKTVELLVNLFGFDVDEFRYGYNLDENRIEIVKGPGKGTKGHFSILCDDILAAKAFLQSKGVRFEDGGDFTPDGKLWKCFALDEISGFAWHLAQRGMANNGH